MPLFPRVAMVLAVTDVPAAAICLVSTHSRFNSVKFVFLVMCGYQSIWSVSLFVKL